MDPNWAAPYPRPSPAPNTAGSQLTTTTQPQYPQHPPHPQHPAAPPQYTSSYPYPSPYPYGAMPPPQMWPNPYAHPPHMDPRSYIGMQNDREDASGRWVLEPEDVLLLERVFALEKCPGRELRTQLAQRLNVKPRQVQVWFQNKRQRTKHGAKPTVAEALAHSIANAQQQDTKAGAESAQLLMRMANSSAEGNPAVAAQASAQETADAATRTMIVKASLRGDGSLIASAIGMNRALPDTKVAVPDAATTVAPSGSNGSDTSAAALDAVSQPTRANHELQQLVLNSINASPLAAPGIAVTSKATTMCAHTTPISSFVSAAPPHGRTDKLPDGYTDGRLLWVRPELLAAQHDMLGANATPLYLTCVHGADVGLDGHSAEAVEVIDDDGEDEEDEEDEEGEEAKASEQVVSPDTAHCA